MTTPEGRVKANIKKVLERFKVYYLMPVQMGIGAAGVDFHCAIGVKYEIDGIVQTIAVAFFIEAKKPGDVPTRRQDTFIKDRQRDQNAITFVIDDDPSIGHITGGLEKLTMWLEQIEKNNERLP
jgi:hypothetical protein